MIQKLLPQTRRFVLASVFAASATVATSASANELAALREQIAQLQSAVEKLEQQQNESPRIRAGANGLRVDSPDGAFNFRVNGLVQLDARYYLNSDSPGTDTYDLRRVRPTLQGTLGRNLGFRFTPELSGNVRILDAYGDFTFAEKTTLRFGNFKGPLGLERLQGGANLLFNERGFATEFTPARDLGIQLQHSIGGGKTVLTGGIFNGALDGSNGAPGASSNGDFAVAGSVFLQPFRGNSDSALRGLGFGIAGSYENRDGNAAFRIRSPNRLDVARSGNILEDGNAYRINPGVYYYNGPFGLLAEYILSSRELHLAGNDARRYDNHGWTIGGSYFLTGENNSYVRVNPATPFEGFGNGGSGAWELALRYTGVRVDSDLFADGLLNDEQAQNANSYAIGLNWYPTGNLKALLSFDHTTYSGGAAGFDRSSDNTILSRLQVAF